MLLTPLAIFPQSQNINLRKILNAKNKKHQKLDTLLDLREFGRVNHLFAPARVLCHWADTPYCATGRTLRTVPMGGHSVLCHWADTPYCANGRTLRTVPLGGHSVLCQWADTPYCATGRTLRTVPMGGHSCISSEGDDNIVRR
jgi:hypothetical protein